MIERRNWASDESSDDATVSAGRRALAEAGVDPSDVGLLINTSVTRKHLEPSVAVRLHHGLGLPSSAINFDVANACLGFVSGMSLAANMIESGQIRYAIVVNGEDADEIQINTIRRLLRTDVGRDGFMSEFASLTLGSGAAAAVLGRTDEHPRPTASSAASHAADAQLVELGRGTGDAAEDAVRARVLVGAAEHRSGSARAERERGELAHEGVAADVACRSSRRMVLIWISSASSPLTTIA